MKIVIKTRVICFVGLCLLFVEIFGINNASAWVGTGNGGSSSSSGSGYSASTCNDDNLWMYAVDCAGVSWAYYKALSETNQNTVFPALQSEPTNIKNATIPAECSKNGGGFWHFGINSFGAKVSGGMLYTGGYYGHWSTMNAGHYTTEWALYRTANLSGKTKQSFGVYTLDHYGTANEVLAAYRQAVGENVPSIGDDVWGFCWNPDMAGSTFVGDSSVAEVPENYTEKPWVEISEDEKAYTDWQSESKLDTPTYVVNNCDPEKGCWVSFRHYLKRISGSGSTKFFINRELGDDVGLTIHKFTATNSGENVAANPVKMYPGQKLCETLSFYAKSDSDSNVVGYAAQTRICAAAVATKGSDISVQIRDENSSEEYHDSDWSKGLTEVYAKPGDNVELKGTYSPYYQSMYNTGISGSFKVNGFADENKSIGSAFDAKIDPNWKNAFSIKVGGQCGDAINGNIGSNNEYSEDRSYRVQGSDVGESNIKSGNAMTNCNNNAKNTPNSVGLTYSDKNGFDVNVDISSKLSNDVKIKVPYNFQNSTDIELSEKTIYAGESTTVSYDVIVGARDNSLTNGNYATPVPNASWGLEMKIGNGDWLAVSDSGGNGNLNSPTENGGIGYSLDGNTEQKGRNVSIPVPDVPAGTEVCFRSWVSPSLSGANENLSESGFDKKPAWDEDCTKIAKRPSFQVWGGGIYSAGNLNLEKTLANKITLGGYADGMYVFGSWAELSLIAEGEVRGFASGAGLGYGMTADAGNASQQKAIETLGGRNSGDYCLMSTLSIANSDCNSAGVGNLGRNSGRSGDKSSLISDFVQGSNQFNIEGEFSLSGVDDNRKTDKGVYYYDGKNKKLSISESAIGAGATKVVRTNNDIAILGNIVYQNDDYSNLESIPKIIIYAKNISISCSVTRIDAVLIADEKINTCSDNITDNSSLRSIPLMIRGSVISDTLTLGRTYGAATGKNSVIPAEIINYDTSLYLWANNQSSATTSGKLTETYINELAPRY